MVILLCSFSASGPSFSPHRAEAELGITFQFKIEKGEKWERTGIISGHGCGIISGSRDPASLMSVVEKTISGLRHLGADEFEFKVEVLHDGQCNFELDAGLITRVARLGMGISISTYLDEAAFSL